MYPSLKFKFIDLFAQIQQSLIEIAYFLLRIFGIGVGKGAVELGQLAVGACSEGVPGCGQHFILGCGKIAEGLREAGIVHLVPLQQLH